MLHKIDRELKSKREVLFLKDIPDEESARKLELKKLREDMKQEQDCFKRSKLTFELVDKAGTEPIGCLLAEEQRPVDPMKGSPLKNEKPSASIIQEVVPLFPL